MTQVTDIIASLHEYERAVLPFLLKTQDMAQIEKLSKLDQIKVQRALQWLSNKNLITLTYLKKDYVDLDENGKAYKEKGLPERRFLDAVGGTQEYTTKDIEQKTGLSQQEIGASLGLLKSLQAITSENTKKGLILKITDAGRKLLTAKMDAEIFLNLEFPADMENFSDEQKKVLEQLLKRRQIINVVKKQFPQVQLTQLGQQVAAADTNTLQKSTINTLNAEIIKSGEWKRKQIRPIDVQSRVPAINAGRIHPLSAVIRLVREIFIEMGFSEMKGPWVETAFWCMDSMWIPQDHPARDVQDTFFLNKYGSLPDNKIVQKVREVHETGAKTGSKGYGYVWDPKLAQQLLLRTHTTATTFRYFGQKNIKGPAKYFCVDKVFRNEAIDATHLPEFYQVEGFVIDDGLSLKHLLGLIREFYGKLGFHNIKFKVTYNPYTESSIEAHYFDPKRKKWTELINSGVFRPESLSPYGITQPVIAWGMGLERLAMLMLEQERLKDIVGTESDLSWLRSYKQPLRE